MSNWDGNITVNLYSTAQAVDVQSFGTPLLASDGATFASVLVKTYETIGAVNDDTELDAACKAAGAAFFSQPQHPRYLKIGKVALASLATDLDAVKAEDNGWYGLIIDDRTDVYVEDASDWAEANEKLYLGQTASADVASGTEPNIAKTLQDSGNTRSALLWYPTDGDWADMSIMALKLAVDPDSQTTIWGYAQPAGVTVDSDTDDTEKTQILSYDANLYLPFKGVPCFNPGQLVDGKYIDTLISKDWFKARVEEKIAQVLLDASALGSKIPFTNAGIEQIAAAIRSVQLRGERLGHFRVGESTMVIPDISEVDSADILARTLTLSATCVLTGAIQEVTLNVAILES